MPGPPDRRVVDGIPDVPVYASGEDAVSLLRWLGGCQRWQADLDDEMQAAIRWALTRLQQEARN